jgi:nucleoside-diphosphate-sugar epimerase
MNIFIAGSTGVLGRRLINQLSGRGHQVTGLVRGRDGERLVESLGGRPRFADLFDTRALVHAAEGAEVIIHAATAIPTKARATLRDWEANDRIRREGTRALADCAARIGAKQLIFQSVVWVARPADDGEFDEDSPIEPDPILQSARDGEGIVQDAGAQHGFAACVLRCGFFYGSDATHTRMLVAGLKRRRIPIIGTGNAVWRLLHADDAAGAFVTATESGKGGLWHVVDDEPVTVADLLNALARRLGAPPPRHLPIWLARVLAGRDTVEFFTRSTRTGNARFKRDFGWQPQFPTYREGIEEIKAKG